MTLSKENIFTILVYSNTPIAISIKTDSRYFTYLDCENLIMPSCRMIITQYSLLCILYRFTSCMLTCWVLSGEFSRIGLSQKLFRVSITLLPQCTCNGPGLRWAGQMKKCSAIGSVSYRVSKPLDSSWSTALQEREAVCSNRQLNMFTAHTHWAGPTQGDDTEWMNTCTRTRPDIVDGPQTGRRRSIQKLSVLMPLSYKELFL